MPLEVVETIEQLRLQLNSARSDGATVGLVPTMGGLHAGHASLMEQAHATTDLAVASIFVNPLQFGEEADLLNYPRDLDKDSALAAAAGVDIIFAPTVDEMYPGGEIATAVTVSGISERWEGPSRVGHFDGVATVVSKLFNIVGECAAYFGEKDWQQLAVVRKMVADLSFPVSVVGCPTVREPDGLALSSRNVFLVGPHRRAATVLHRAAKAGKASIEDGETDPHAVSALMTEMIEAEQLAEPIYAVAVDAANLEVPKRLTGQVRLLVAAQVGIPRLIDNVGAVSTITGTT